MKTHHRPLFRPIPSKHLSPAHRRAHQRYRLGQWLGWIAVGTAVGLYLGFLAVAIFERLPL